MYGRKSKLILAGGVSFAAALSMASPASALNSGTATESLNGGGYSVLSQSTIAFPATTLDGTNQTLAQTATGAIDFSDATASALGWNITAQVSSVFTNTVHNVADGATTNLSTTVTSATAGFTGSDAGLFITAVGIPANATIVSVTNATTVVISAAATATGASLALKVLSTMPNATISLNSRTALTCDGGSTCTVGTDSGAVTYAKQVPTTPTAATKIFSSSVGTGMGNMGSANAQTWGLGGTLVANAVRAGSYTATITYTMSGGI